jgi:hypothetical protein
MKLERNCISSKTYEMKEKQNYLRGPRGLGPAFHCYFEEPFFHRSSHLEQFWSSSGKNSTFITRKEFELNV